VRSAVGAERFEFRSQEENNMMFFLSRAGLRYNEKAIAPARRPIAGAVPGRRGACLAVRIPPAALLWWCCRCQISFFSKSGLTPSLSRGPGEAALGSPHESQPGCENHGPFLRTRSSTCRGRAADREPAVAAQGSMRNPWAASARAVRFFLEIDRTLPLAAGAGLPAAGSLGLRQQFFRFAQEDLSPGVLCKARILHPLP
jgi:hypothetical protein